MEDICSGTIDGVNYVFAADMGNNLYNRDEIKIIRFKEMDLSTE